MTEEKNNKAAEDIRTLRTERIKGVDIMVNRAIERILAADGDGGQNAAQPEQQAKPAKPRRKKAAAKNEGEAAPQKPKTGDTEEKPRKRKSNNLKKVIIGGKIFK